MMEIITADFETYYDKDYSLSKITTEEYIRHERFQVIMLGLRMPDGEQRVITGTKEEIQYEIDAIPWWEYAVLCHNTLFDGAILSWIFGVKPKLWLDTLGMARAMHGNKGNSLKVLSESYGLEEKGTYVANMMGRTLESITTAEFQLYSEYCLKDCDITYNLFNTMSQGWYSFDPYDNRGPFPKDELKLIDRTIRMYTEPCLELNKDRLEEHLQAVVDRKAELLSTANIGKEQLMSNPKFATLLEGYGVVVPMKVSPTTGKPAYAFAKTDEGMKDLLEHPNIDVQAIVAARMGVKSTIEETRTVRLISIAERGSFPVPLRYYATKTGRWGGTDKVNLQNLPSHGANVIKSCIEAPKGYVIIDCDSSNIEARGLAWLAGQEDLVTDFRNKVDVYCKMGGVIYGREITKEDKPERFLSKTVVLGAGYGTGANKLYLTLKIGGIETPLAECERIIQTYRYTYPMIPALWRQAERALWAINDGQSMWLGRAGELAVDGKRGIKLPNGMYIRYSQLHPTQGEKGIQWMYKDDDGMTKIYGAKLIENVTQALARIIVGQQMLRIAKRYKVVMTVHDAVAWVARKEEAEEAAAYGEACMRWVPDWAEGWPLNCEYGVGDNYGEC